MGFGQATKTCIDKFITFSGRASRSEFWWFAALFFAVHVLLRFANLGGLGTLIWFAVVVPFLAVAWRRMHDAGNTGALLLLPAVVMTAAIYVGMFQILIPFTEHMAQFEIDPDMTLRELQEQQQAALSSSGLEERTPFTPLSLSILAIGAFWMTYLLARPSQPLKNIYGPNPNEVPS